MLYASQLHTHADNDTSILCNVKVPYENYRKVFRTSQKNIEKELGAIQTAASELSRKARAGLARPDEALKSIDAMMKRAEGLKKKVCPFIFV